MRFSTTQHQCYGGLDLHARRMYVGGLHQDGELVGHRYMNTSPDPWLKVLAPYRAALVIAGECGFTWSWLAALGAQAGLPVVRRPARYMQALPGGKAQNDRMAAHQMAGLLRGGLLPQASADPAAWRAPRDRLRRRKPRMRQRAALFAHVQKTNRQDNRPARGQQLAYTANRQGIAERFAEPAVQQSRAGDRTRIAPDDPLRTDRA